jgi:hypothetical protein
MCFAHAAEAAKSKGVAEYYKANVKALVLKEQAQPLSGRILAFRANGLVFLRAKEGPFHRPKPEYIPISHVLAFVDEHGKPLWGEIPIKKNYDFLKIRNYQAKIGVHYGVGRQTSSYTFSPLISEAENYIQEMNAGETLGGQIGYFLSPHYSVGVKYLKHNSKAEIYSLASDAAPPIHDNILIQNYMFDVSYYQSISRMIIFYADVAMGGLFYTIDRKTSQDGAEISGTSFGTVLSGGVDFLLTRNIALGFELSFLFSNIKNLDVQGNTAEIDASQNLNRFDVSTGLKIYL